MNTTKKFYVQPTIIVHEIQNHLMDNGALGSDPHWDSKMLNPELDPQFVDFSFESDND